MYEKWDYVLRHFTIYCKNKCSFGDLTVDFCKGFRNYLLKAQRQRSNGKEPIFHNSAAGYWSTLRALLKIAGITRKITFHSMRHSFATLFAANGMDILTISKMLTHKSVQNTQIYAAVVDERKRDASKAISLK